MQDALSDVDWEVFQTTSINIDEFADTVISFNAMLVNTFIPTATIRSFPNQKTWIESTFRTALTAWTTAYKHRTHVGHYVYCYFIWTKKAYESG